MVVVLAGEVVLVVVASGSPTGGSTMIGGGEPGSPTVRCDQSQTPVGKMVSNRCWSSLVGAQSP